jgi:hypothetical protein
MKLTGQPQAPVALLAVKELSVPIEYETEWDQEMVWTFREAPFALAGSRNPDGQVRSAVDIPTTLSRLQLCLISHCFRVKPKLM